MYTIETFTVGAFQCNCSILFHTQSRKAVVIDPGDEVEAILERLHAHKLDVVALWHTHAHIDHIGATKDLYEVLIDENKEKGLANPKIFLHEGDKWLYENIAVQAKMLGLNPHLQVTSTFDKINDGMKMEHFEGVKSIHTPGHTPGSCCLDINMNCDLEMPRNMAMGVSEAPRILISGDTLFRRGIGRTDLWGGDSALIQKSIQNKIYKLKEETLVIPGHGPVTTLEEEKAKNPFVKA